MVNMAVEWAGPNLSLATLVPELNGRFGAPTRPYEFVTGYKSASNYSGHNADANGRGHSMDIFVGGANNISIEQGIDLAERLRLEGKRGSIPGHPDRLAYIIHRGRIAGDHTNWEWVAYTGLADHYDHIHVSSVFDYYWGDPVAGNPLDYNSTAAWNLWATSTQGSDKTPIQEDTLSAAEVNEINTFTQKAIQEERATIVAEIRAATTATSNTVIAERKTIVQEVRANANALANLPAKDIAAAIPDNLAQQIIDLLAERLVK